MKKQAVVTSILFKTIKILFRNEDTGWNVLQGQISEKSAAVTVTGVFITVNEGEYYTCEGEWGEHPTFGKQFKVISAQLSRPKSLESIKKYLSSGLIKNIGEKTAQKIVEFFGENTFETLDQNPSLLLTIPRMSRKKLQSILESWREQKASRDVLYFLNSHQIPINLAKRIFSKYGTATQEILTENPYRMCTEVTRVGFLTADKIALNMGFTADSSERVKAAIEYQLQQFEDQGHCYSTTVQLVQGLTDLLKIPETIITEHLGEALLQLNADGQIVSLPYESISSPTTRHARLEIMDAEIEVAEITMRMLNQKPKLDPTRFEYFMANDPSVKDLSTTQKRAVQEAVSNSVFILTGGPGVGKTTTARAIIAGLKYLGKKISLAAPTGRAAQRLAEVTGMQASTIHRLIRWKGDDAEVEEGDPIVADCLLVDEVSMLDITLARLLWKALRLNTQLILVGDVDQLPSVGPGSVLRDLIDSLVVPTLTLTEIFRQASASNIIRFSHAINHGQIPDFPKTGGDCHFIEAEDSFTIKNLISELVTSHLPQKYHFDPMRDVQLLVPMHKGELGTTELNDYLQKLLNPRSRDQAGSKEGAFFPGDKVIQTANNYELLVFNGDIGFVTAAQFDRGKVNVQFSDRTVTYKKEQADDLKLAYAITIHKSQGSEFPVVIIPLHTQHFVMLQRNLIYTALTRAKRLAIFIGVKRALYLGIQNVGSQNRQTQLKDYLCTKHPIV